MESVESRPVNDGGLVPDEHALAVVEGVYHHCSCVPETDLEDGPLVFAPPGLADSGMVRAEREEVPSYGKGEGDFGNASYKGDVG